MGGLGVYWRFPLIHGCGVKLLLGLMSPPLTNKNGGDESSASLEGRIPAAPACGRSQIMSLISFSMYIHLNWHHIWWIHPRFTPLPSFQLFFCESRCCSWLSCIWCTQLVFGIRISKSLGILLRVNPVLKEILRKFLFWICEFCRGNWSPGLRLLYKISVLV